MSVAPLDGITRAKPLPRLRFAYQTLRGSLVHFSDTDANLIRRWLYRYSAVRAPYRHVNYLLSVAYERWCLKPEMEFDNYHDARVWNFDSAVEQERYARTITAVQLVRCGKNWGDVLEVGCSEGAFTERIAPLCRSLLACDVSGIACCRARNRCAMPHVTVQQLDVATQPLARAYDIVFALDVIDLVHGRERIKKVWDKLVHAVRPGGVLAVSSCRLPEDLRASAWSTLLIEGADEQIAYLRRHPAVRLLQCELYPDATCQSRPAHYLEHLIAVFEKKV